MYIDLFLQGCLSRPQVQRGAVAGGFCPAVGFIRSCMNKIFCVHTNERIHCVIIALFVLAEICFELLVTIALSHVSL